MACCHFIVPSGWHAAYSGKNCIDFVFCAYAAGCFRNPIKRPEPFYRKTRIRGWKPAPYMVRLVYYSMVHSVTFQKIPTPW